MDKNYESKQSISFVHTAGLFFSEYLKFEWSTHHYFGYTVLLACTAALRALDVPGGTAVHVICTA